jgi:hypothetical protein
MIRPVLAAASAAGSVWIAASAFRSIRAGRAAT